MYRGRLWTMRQYAGFGTAEETNARFRHLLAAGQTGLSVAFDLPTQMGYDSDHPMAEGEVGPRRRGDRHGGRSRAAVPRDPPGQGLHLDDDQRDGRHSARDVRRGGGGAGRVPRSALQGTIQNDILKEFIARGTYIYPPEPSLRLIVDVFRFVSDEAHEVQSHLDLGLPHPRGGGDGRAGARVHLRRRARVRAPGGGGGARRRTASRPVCRSSSRATPICSRRSRSSAPRAACGPAS